MSVYIGRTDTVAGFFAADQILAASTLRHTLDLNASGKRGDRTGIGSVDSVYQTLPRHYPVESSRIHMKESEPFADETRYRTLAGPTRSVHRYDFCHLLLRKIDFCRQLYQSALYN